MSEYRGCPVFGSIACPRCGVQVNGMYWANFIVNGEHIGDVCENCRCELMADYIIPCAARLDGEWTHTGSARTIGERLRRAADLLRRESPRADDAVDPSAADPGTLTPREKRS